MWRTSFLVKFKGVLGTVLYSAGIVLLITTVVHLLRLQMEALVDGGSEYLTMAESIAISLPTAAPTATPTLTPIPSATPLPTQTPTQTPTLTPTLYRYRRYGKFRQLSSIRPLLR
ncbi:MAG: hypothetical protein R2932_50340 [Caldilineaceae bacterium]